MCWNVEYAVNVTQSDALWADMEEKIW
jgi:hypothetical protein